jgi:hypothetical protein
LAPRCAAVIAGRELFGARSAFRLALSPQRLSIRLTAAPISTSGITPGTLRACDL